MAPKIWLITGASSGLGRAVTEHVLAQGEIAIATCRTPKDLSDLTSMYGNQQLLVLKVDVSKPQDIQNAFAQVGKHFGRLDIVYSNAGFLTMGEIEAMPDDVSRSQFEVNYWGAVTVAKEAVKFFREVNKPVGGRLMVAGSAVGVASMPTLGQYSATKFAIDGIHESFSKEVDPSWNIKFTIIICGGFNTRALKPQSLVSCPPHPAYTHSQVTGIRQLVSSGDPQGGDAYKAAKVLYKIGNDPSAPLRVPVGMDAVEVLKARIEEAAKEVEYASHYATDFE